MSVTAPPRRTKLAQYEAQLAEFAERERGLVEWLAGSPAREAAGRREAILTKAKLGAVSPVERERQQRRKKEAELESVRLNAAAVAALLDEERVADRVHALAGINGRVAELQDAVRDELRSFGEQFKELHETWLAICDAVQELDAYRMYGPGVAVTLGVEHERWVDTQARIPLHPLCGDFPMLLTETWELAADERGVGWREGKGRGRDDFGELVRLLPDLRGKTRRVSLVRNAYTRYSEGRQA